VGFKMRNTLVLDEKAIEQALDKMASEMAACNEETPIALIGIRRGGAHVASLLIPKLEKLLGLKPPLGSVDISLYRDDGFNPNDWPNVGVTDIPFSMRDYCVILVDDVLFTGRTVRSALDAILDYGRPKAVKLATLVDRGCRELPIQPDVVGATLSTEKNAHVDVQLVADGAQVNRVILEGGE
jgi:pyrimidine operon attenuation protein / uracil phosphoribosyltransferase